MALAAKEADKVAAQRELHELQLACRSNGDALSGGVRDVLRGGVPGAAALIIEDLEAAGIGAHALRAPPRSFLSIAGKRSQHLSGALQRTSRR